MLEAGTRRKNQPPPPRIVHEALVEPDRDPARPWLSLLHDEQRPRVLQSRQPDLVVWSSLWVRWPTAQVRFDLDADSGTGTDLRWTLLLDGPAAGRLVGHWCKRLNQIVNADLRYSFGQ